MGADNLNSAGQEQRSYSSQLISEGLTEREKRTLSEAIDRSILSRPLPNESFDETSKGLKSGLVLPVLINLGAVLLVAAVFAAFSLSFQDRRYRMAIDESRYYTTEGKLLEAYKKQSDQQLRDKDNLIYRIYKQLELLESQKDEMGRLMDLNIVKKREILDGEIAKNRTLELERLKTLGYEEGKIADLMSDYDQSAIAARESEISQYQKQSMKLLKDREEALIAEINAKERSLRMATEQLDGEMGGMAPETAVALAELNQISANREKEALLMDQINASYLQAIDRIASYDTDAALLSLANLKQIYSQSPLRDVPNVAKRYAVDLSVIETLEEFVTQRQAWVETPVTMLSEQSTPADDELESETLTKRLNQMQEQLANQEQRIRFLSATNSEKDDTIEDLSWKLDKSLEMVEFETAKGLETGRKLAFEDMQTILSAYEELEPSDIINTMSDGSTVAFSDEKVYQIYEDFMAVLINFAKGYSEIQASFKLIGTATLITGNRVVVEPLTPTQYSEGTPMEIRQLLGDGRYRVVAKGEILSSTPGKITATIASYPISGVTPRVNDQVYIAAEFE